MKTKTKKQPPAYVSLPCGTILMALDVSSSATGIAVGEIESTGLVVHSFGVARPPSSWSFDRKIDFMMEEIERTAALYWVNRIAIEWQDHRSTMRRVQGLAVLGQAQGAIWSRLRDRVPIDRIPVRDATKLNGKNTKKEKRCEYVKTMVPAYAKKVASEPKFDAGLDASDALCLLMFRINQSKGHECCGPVQ